MADGYAVVRADEAEDAYAGSEVPGEFRRLTALLGAEQLAATLIRVPPHCDFEQGSGHFHDEVEEPVEIWAILRQLDHGDATKVDDFWEPSPRAARTR